MFGCNRMTAFILTLALALSLSSCEMLYKTFNDDASPGNSSASSAPKIYIWNEAAVSSLVTPRSEFGMISFHNALWIIGGVDHNGNSNCCDIYQTIDGTNWTMITTDADFGKRRRAAYAVFNNTLWMTGGEKDGDLNSDVWCSPNGFNWYQTNSSAQFGKRAGHSLVAFHGALWLIGGRTFISGGNETNDIWMSRDGTNWARVTLNGGFHSREYQSVLVFNGSLWLTGGGTNNAAFNDTWFSRDGTNWQNAGNTPFSGRTLEQSVVYDNRIWTICGFSSGTWSNIIYKEIWNTADGTNWDLVTADAPFGKIYGQGVCEYEGSLWLAGGMDESGINLGSVWFMK